MSWEVPVSSWKFPLVRHGGSTAIFDHQGRKSIRRSTQRDAQKCVGKFLAPWFVCLRSVGGCFPGVLAVWAALAFGLVVLFRWWVLSSDPVVLGFTPVAGVHAYGTPQPWCWLRGSYRRGAEIPTRKVLVRSEQRASDPRTSKIKSCVLVFEWPRASRSTSHVGGMSGHTFCSPVALGCACWWLSLVWRWYFWRLCSWRWCFSLACGFGVSRFPLRGPRPEDRFFPQVSPSMFWDFGSLHQKHRQSAGPWL